MTVNDFVNVIGAAARRPRRRTAMLPCMIASLVVLFIIAAGTAEGYPIFFFKSHSTSDPVCLVAPDIQRPEPHYVHLPGDTILVEGLTGRVGCNEIMVQVLAPSGATITLDSVMPGELVWQWSMFADFDVPGTYVVRAYHPGGDRASTTFEYVMGTTGHVVVNGTTHAISYTGTPIVSAHTDATAALMYLGFEGAASGVMDVPNDLYSGRLVAVEGGSITKLSDGIYKYSTDTGMLVLAADSVAVPEFGGAALLVSALATSAALPLARRVIT